MKTPILAILVAGVLAAASPSGLALAQTAKTSPGPAQTAMAAPRLASGVKAQAAYEPVGQRLVLANPTQIYSDILITSPPTGELTSVGQPLNAIAKVRDWDWYLVGRDGVGIGYVSRGVLKPASAQ